MSEEMVDLNRPPRIRDLHALALEWAACRRALRTVDDLSEEERGEFALLAALELFGED